MEGTQKTAKLGWVERFGEQLIFARSPFSPLKLSPDPTNPNPASVTV